MRGARAALSGLTTRGRCLLSAGGALVACAFVLGQRDLLRAGVFLLVLPLVAVAVVARTRYRLSCTRRLEPSRVEAGVTATVRLHLENVSRLPSGVLLMEDTLPYALGGRPRFVLDKVEPQGARDVSYPVRSDVRGRYPVGPLAVRLTDPFGLCELQRSFATADDLVVTPVVMPLPSVRLGGDWAAGGEASARAVAASGSDDIATREYRYGDDLRRVHWRSTARTGELMVRREEQPFQSRAALLLDGRAGAHRGEGPASSFEWAVSATASAAVSLLRTGFGLQLLRESGQPLGVPGVPVTEALLLEALATTGTARVSSLDGAVQRLRRDSAGGAVVAVLGALDPDEAQQLARLRSGSMACVAVLVDTDSWVSISAGPRARAAARHEQSAVLLRAAGWRVLPVTHGTTLASVWPLAGGRAAAHRPAAAPPPPVSMRSAAGRR
jgi:uncharacterized protein (DUF58 family)